MTELSLRIQLLLSLQRALWGAVHPRLRQASIEVDELTKLIRLRFEYDGEPEEYVRNSCSCAATEVLADFDSSWNLEEQHLSAPLPAQLSQLEHLAYLRAEQQTAA